MPLQSPFPRELKPIKEVERNEIIPTFEESFAAQKKQMMKNSRITKKYTEEEINLMIKNAIVSKLYDRIDFLVAGGIRRAFHTKRYGLDEDEYREFISTHVKNKMKEKGYPLELTKVEKEKLAELQTRKKKEAIEEASKIHAEALKGIFSSIQ